MSLHQTGSVQEEEKLILITVHFTARQKCPIFRRHLFNQRNLGRIIPNYFSQICQTLNITRKEFIRHMFSSFSEAQFYNLHLFS